jgi:hypothetical protein
MATSANASRFAYEPDYPKGHPKQKHGWNEGHAGFVRQGGEIVGKCPKGIDNKTAERLLNEAVNVGLIYSDPRWQKPYPQKIFVVHDGVVYRAKPTNPGRSYHAFPERPKALREGSRDLRDRLIARARALGCEAEVRAWIDKKEEVA